MIHANLRVPLPVNEPIKTYAPGTVERAEVKAALNKLSGECPELPLIIVD